MAYVPGRLVESGNELLDCITLLNSLIFLTDEIFKSL
jgi:hypothetical protein